MSSAWVTILVFSLLAPGFLFLTGIYIPQQITRDAASWRTPGQISAIVIVSFSVHIFLGVLLYVISHNFEITNYSVLYLFDHGKLLNSLSSGISSEQKDLLLWFVAYLFGSALTGLFTGIGVGHSVVKGRFRFLVNHSWAFDLIDKVQDGIAISYVLTNIPYNEKYLMYKGALKEFFVGQDGKISYLILSNAEKFRIRTGRDKEESGWIPLEQDKAQLFIEGQDIANIVFSETPVKKTPEGVELLNKTLENIRLIVSSIENKSKKPSKVSKKKTKKKK